MSTTTKHTVPAKGHKKAQGGTVSILSTGWTVTNNTGIDLVMIDAFASDPTSAAQLYQSSLQLLSTTEGGQALKAGETKTISIGEAHTGADGNTVDFTILIARADNLFPVKVIELAAGSDSFPDATVTAADADLLRKAEDFVQMIAAFPSSQMTQDFAAAVASHDEQKVTDFFQSYPAYASVTLEAVTAVQTYYSRYGFVWAGYNKTQAYFLYTSDGATTKKNLGTLTISNGVAAPITNLDAPVGYTVTYTDVNHRNTVLHYLNGQFSDDANSSTPAICLQGLFMLKSQLTNQDTDNTLVPTLFGVVNGNQAVGYVADAGTPSEPFIASLLDPQGVGGWLKLSGLALGIVLAIVGIGVVSYIIIKKLRKGSAPVRTPEEIERLTRQKYQQIADRMAAARIQVPENLDAALTDIKTAANTNLLENARGKMKYILDQQFKIGNTMLDYGRTDKLMKAMAAIESDQMDVPMMDQQNLDLNLPTLRQHISQNAKILSDRYNTISQKLDARESKLVADCKANAERSTSFLDTSEAIRKDLNDGELPEIIEE